MDFDSVAMILALPVVGQAALVNLWIAVVATAIALVIATAITILRALRLAPLTAAIDIVVSAVRGTPILIQIFLFYYGLPSLGLDISPLVAGFCAVAFNSSMFVSELMRGGITGMDRGPVEAAVALALPRRIIWLKVILPQLYLRILPALIGEVTMVVKATVLLSSITVVEALRTAQQIASSNFRFLEMMLAAGIALAAINLAIAATGTLIERRIAAMRG
jgi:His/Glu/Gln/Arg/opine family amino acid ABC transporter permease subunit